MGTFFQDEKVCPICGKIFAQNHSQKYCSPSCSRLGKKRGVFPLYDSRRRRIGISDRERTSVLRAYDGECALCGWHKSRCDIHHIVSVKDGGDNSFGNLIVLCPNCHRLADSGIISKEDLYANQKQIDKAYGL